MTFGQLRIKSGQTGPDTIELAWLSRAPGELTVRCLFVPTPTPTPRPHQTLAEGLDLCSVGEGRGRTWASHGSGPLQALLSGLCGDISLPDSRPPGCRHVCPREKSWVRVGTQKQPLLLSWDGVTAASLIPSSKPHRRETRMSPN